MAYLAGDTTKAQSGPINLLVTLDRAVETVLAEYEDRQAQEDTIVEGLNADEVGRRRDELIVSVGRATGLLLNILIRESCARSILEIGTGYGYSTLWLADAARATRGKVDTIEVAAQKLDHARLAVARARLQDYVEFHNGDALKVLASLEHNYDLVLLDIWKDLYIPCIDAVMGRLNTGAIVVADNMLKPINVRFAGVRYQAHLRKYRTLQTIVIPVGSGLAISRCVNGI